MCTLRVFIKSSKFSKDHKGEKWRKVKKNNNKKHAARCRLLFSMYTENYYTIFIITLHIKNNTNKKRGQTFKKKCAIHQMSTPHIHTLPRLVGIT